MKRSTLFRLTGAAILSLSLAVMPLTVAFGSDRQPRQGEHEYASCPGHESGAPLRLGLAGPPWISGPLGPAPQK